jgi:antitoxin HigA-1
MDPPRVLDLYRRARKTAEPARAEAGSMKLSPVHTGEILFEEFMRPLGISQNRLARDLHVPPYRINQIVHGKRRLTADTALRLSRYFGTSARFWMGLQADYDLDVAEDSLADAVAGEVAPRNVKIPAKNPRRS